MQPSLLIALWLLANFFAVGCYDVVAYFFLEQNQTVSFWLQKWLREWPVLGVVLGIVIGHLAWPLNVSAPLREKTQ